MARITDGSGSRWYVRPGNPQRYLSVTTIIDLGIPKPQLIGWAAKVTATHAYDNIDVLYSMQKKGAVTASALKDPQKASEAIEAARTGAIDWLKGEKNRSKDRAALKGSDVHEAIEAYKLERPFPGVTAAAQPYYDAFMELLDKHEPIILQTEANVYNEERRYAGTLDTIGVWPSLKDRIPEPWGDERGPVVLADYKTGKGPGKKGIYPEAALQLAAYRRATFIDAPDGSEIEMPQVDATVVVHLQPGWAEIVPVITDDAVFNHFLHAYETARWTLETSKNVIGKPWEVINAPKPVDVPAPKQGQISVEDNDIQSEYDKAGERATQ